MKRCAIVACLALVACSGSKSGPTLHGQVIYYAPYGQETGCASAMPLSKQIRLTVKDQTGAVIATTTASEFSEATSTPAQNPAQQIIIDGLGEQLCADRLGYSVTVPKADFYTVVVDGLDPSKQPPAVSYSDLQAKGFANDIVAAG